MKLKFDNLKAENRHASNYMMNVISLVQNVDQIEEISSTLGNPTDREKILEKARKQLNSA